MDEVADMRLVVAAVVVVHLVAAVLDRCCSVRTYFDLYLVLTYLFERDKIYKR